MPSYTPVSVSSYDASPPVDNGAETDANRIKWSTIKTKLSDPLNTAVGSIDDNIATAITTITSNLSTSNSTLTTVNSTYTTVSGRMYAPSGTVAVFVQTSAPTGWTKGATHNNKALRVVSGSVTTGGSTAFTSVFTSRTIATANLPSHTHSWSDGASLGAGITITLGGSSVTSLISDVTLTGNDEMEAGSGGCVDDIDLSEEALAGTITIASTATGSTGSGSAMDFAVRYVDVIFATKD